MPPKVGTGAADSPSRSPRKTPPSMLAFVPSLEKLDMLVPARAPAEAQSRPRDPVINLYEFVQRPCLLSTIFAHEFFGGLRVAANGGGGLCPPGASSTRRTSSVVASLGVSGPPSPASSQHGRALPLWRFRRDVRSAEDGQHSPSLYSLPSAMSLLARTQQLSSSQRLTQNGAAPTSGGGGGGAAIGSSTTPHAAEHTATFDDIKDVFSDMSELDALEDRALDGSVNVAQPGAAPLPLVAPPSPLTAEEAMGGSSSIAPETPALPSVGFFSSHRVITEPPFPLVSHVHSIDNIERCVDNENADLVMYVGMVLLEQYEVVRMLGCGTFGQVALCRELTTHRLVAVKVIKSNQAFEYQSSLEVGLIMQLCVQSDPRARHVPRILHQGNTYGHHAFAMELLGMNLFQLIEMNNYRGLSVASVREIAFQMLQALSFLWDNSIIHCDVKPENAMLRQDGGGGGASRADDGGDVETQISGSTVTLIDFGSSCFVGEQMYKYIQSRYYRAPEVIIGAPYSTPIDIWSCACVLAELYLGLPLLPGQSDFHQLQRIEEMFGPLPRELLEQGTATSAYFRIQPTQQPQPPQQSQPLQHEQVSPVTSSPPMQLSETQQFAETELPSYSYALMTEDEFVATSGCDEFPPFRRYFNYRTLPELIQHSPLSLHEKRSATIGGSDATRPAAAGAAAGGFDESVVKEIINMRRDFCDLLLKMLRLSPQDRITPHDALSHNFFRAVGDRQ